MFTSILPLLFFVKLPSWVVCNSFIGLSFSPYLVNNPPNYFRSNVLTTSTFRVIFEKFLTAMNNKLRIIEVLWSRIVKCALILTLVHVLSTIKSFWTIFIAFYEVSSHRSWYTSVTDWYSKWPCLSLPNCVKGQCLSRALKLLNSLSVSPAKNRSCRRGNGGDRLPVTHWGVSKVLILVECLQSLRNFHHYRGCAEMLMRGCR